MRASVIQGCFPNGGSVVQRKGNAPLPPNLMQLARGVGQPLPADVLQKMESFFGQSFADVRVYVGPHVQALGATAYTHGTDIHFGPGHYLPQSARGQQLLARQLAHVVQQRSGRVRNPYGNGVAVVRDAQLDAEAERLALRAAIHRPPVQPKRTVQRMTNGRVIQRATVGVGYDRYNNAGAGDTLVTSGLGNCVCIIARNTGNNTTVMAHFDTNQGRIGMSCKVPLQRFKAVLETAVGSTSPAYTVVAGSLATTAISTLQADLTEIFGVGTVSTGYTVSFDVTNTAVTARSLSDGMPSTMPSNWNNAGTAIDYATLTAVAKPKAAESKCIVM